MVAPARLADTRPDQGAFGYTAISSNVVRVQVAGREGVPANATAAVLNVTGVNTTAPGFVTVYPAGTDIPTASNVNFDGVGQVLANMVTVKLGVGGAVDVYMQRQMDVAVDVSGAYVPVSAGVAAGRLVTRPDGAFRVLDTRDRPAGGVAGNSTERVDVGAAGVPADATAVVVNVTATQTGVGFWTAYPLGQDRPNASNLNIDRAGETRAGQAIVLLSGEPAFNVYSQGGGHLIVDVTGWFTGSKSAVTTDGFFLPSNPTRLHRLPTIVRHADVGRQHAGVPGLRPRRPGGRGGGQRHWYRVDDRRVRHGVPVRRRRVRWRRTSTSTRGIRRSPTTRSCERATAASACSPSKGCT